MKVTVKHVNIPAMSTIGTGEGFNEDGQKVTFYGDHRPMRTIGEAINQGVEVEVELEGWQIGNVEPVGNA